MRRSEADEPLDLGPGRLEVAGEAGQILDRLPALQLALPENLQGEVGRIQRLLSHVQRLAQGERPANPLPEAERE